MSQALFLSRQTLSSVCRRIDLPVLLGKSSAWRGQDEKFRAVGQAVQEGEGRSLSIHLSVRPAVYFEDRLSNLSLSDPGSTFCFRLRSPFFWLASGKALACAASRSARLEQTRSHSSKTCASPIA